MSLVHVVAIITTKPGKRDEVLKAFAANMHNVHAEDGCIEYGPAIDAVQVGDFQTQIGPDTFMVIEKWESLEHLRAHASTPHMAEYAAKVKHLLIDRIIHVLSPT